jgi:hypothetical protein
MSTEKTERLGVRVPADLAEQVREKSRRTGIPYSVAIRRFLDWWSDDENGSDLLPKDLDVRAISPSQQMHSVARRSGGLEEIDDETLSAMLEYIQSLKEERKKKRSG